MVDGGDRFDASRAELFEVLGHPMRVRILRSLDGRGAGFAELKRDVGIESSGHLQFHLGKLEGLIKVGDDGAYSLTDDGREALRVVSAMGEDRRGRIMLTRPTFGKAALAIAVIVLFLMAVIVVVQQQQIGSLSQSLSQQEAASRLTPFASTEPQNPNVASFSSNWYRNGSLWAALDRAYQGSWYAGVDTKVLWYRSDNGTFGQPLLVLGTRLNLSSPMGNWTVLGNRFTVLYSHYDYQPSDLYFPREGFWQVTGTIGNLILTFVVYVHPHSDCHLAGGVCT